jgi:hypothetical protein
MVHMDRVATQSVTSPDADAKHTVGKFGMANAVTQPLNPTEWRDRKQNLARHSPRQAAGGFGELA